MNYRVWGHVSDSGATKRPLPLCTFVAPATRSTGPWSDTGESQVQRQPASTLDDLLLRKMTEGGDHANTGQP